METIVTQFDGVHYVVPLLGGQSNPFEWASETHDLYPDYCGPGDGWLAGVIPDAIGGVNVRVPCHIHDVCFEIAQPTWGDFHAANSVFLHNLLSAIETMGPIDEQLDNRLSMALKYYRAVDITGALVFWSIKQDQGYGTLYKVYHG